MLETVDRLRKDFENIGSGLVMATEKPEDFIPSLLREDEGSENILVYQQEICSEELAIEKSVTNSVLKRTHKGTVSHVHSVWGSTLYHIDDIP
jgi:hypothetical protein